MHPDAATRIRVFAPHADHRGDATLRDHLLRSLAITPAAFIGSLLWQVRPSLPFLAAGAIGLVGTMLFMLTVNEEHAG